MTTRSWIRTLFCHPTRPVRKGGARCRPSLEALEDRALPAVTFDPAVNYAAGAWPNSVAAGDFNGDGKQDLATANYSSDNVSVLLGKGDGTFQSAANYDSGTASFSVAVGDFNGDGKLDLATANLGRLFFNGDVSVLLGKGDGSFQSAVHYTAGDRPGSVAVGDFNGDGKQDLATANEDSGNASVLLNNPNAAPIDITLSHTSIAENQPAGAVVGTFSTTDPDIGDTFTYELVGGPGDTDNAAFTVEGDQLKAAAPFDFEVPKVYSIRVKSADAEGLAVEIVFAISVSDVNEAPTAIALSASTIAENQPAGAVVGTFSTTDPDIGDTFTYELVGGPGDTDNAAFTVEGDQLKAAASFDFEVPKVYSIRVKSADAGGLAVEIVFTISVSNVNEAPTIRVPGSQTAYEDVDLPIGGGDPRQRISVADADGDGLTVTLAVGRGTLTLGTTTGLSVTGNGGASVTLSGSVADLNAVLATLVYRGGRNSAGPDALTVTATDLTLTANGTVALQVKSAARQAAELRARVDALRGAGALGGNKAQELTSKLGLRGDGRDAGRVRGFLGRVAAFRAAGVLTRAQADLLLDAGDLLLKSVTRR